MPLRRPFVHHLAMLGMLVGALVSSSNGTQAQEGYGRGVPVIGGPAPGDCESCRSPQRPPWHGTVAAGAMGGGMAGRGSLGMGYQSASPCMSGACGPSAGYSPSSPCRPAGACPKCGPPGVCGATGACHPPLMGLGKNPGYSLPPCLPRLHAMCREGLVLSPKPLAIPKCHQCGAFIEGGF